MTKKPPKSERRASHRRVLEVHIDLHTESQFYNGFSKDLSDGGVFVATYTPAKVGSEVDLEFELPAGRKVSTNGRVVWVRESNSELPPGMGVAFENLSIPDRDAILDFTRERPPLFFDTDSIVEKK